MPPVLSRSRRQFGTQQNIIVKVIKRRLGFEDPDWAGKGWHWDQRYLIEDYIAETLPCPDLKDSHLLGIPRSYWQNGPIEGDTGTSLKISEVKEVFSNGKAKWAPILNRGDYIIWREAGYLYSDDSVIELLDPTSLDAGGRSTHTLQRIQRTGDSPISVRIYKRTSENEYIPWRDYIQRTTFTGTLDSDGEEQTTISGDIITWANVDTTRREFFFSVREDLGFLQFNQNVVETITSTVVPSVISDFNDLEYLGSSSGDSNQIFYTTYFPLVEETNLRIYDVNVSAGTWQQLTKVTSFTSVDPPTSVEVKVDYDLGLIICGDGYSGVCPATEHAIYIAYRAIPRIEYEEEDFGDKIIATSADVSPVHQSLNKAFVVLSRSELDVGSITLETSKPSYTAKIGTYGPVYVGADYASLLATVYSSGERVVPGVEVLFEFVTTPPVGGLGGSGDTAERITNLSGEARTFYSPPNSANSMGYFVTTVTGLTQLTVSSDAEFSNVDDVYTYYVLKDDPWLGKDGADTTIGEIPWSVDPPNGRKVVMYHWSASAINPITGEFGAYIPTRPTIITGGNVLTYPSNLEIPEPTSGGATPKGLGAYWIVSDRYIKVRASTYSPRAGRRIYSNELTLRVELPPYMKGEYISDALLRVPFGWRILDGSYEYASALNGATFICINPVSGPYPIVDVIAGETWDEDEFWDYEYTWGGVSVTRPFAHFGLTWTIT